jgi:glucokinase
MTALLADIGGTKTQLALQSPSGVITKQAYVFNLEYESLNHLLADFLPADCVPNTAVIAVAGPVDEGIRCQMTNLPWFIDGESVQAQFGIEKVALLNDLQATAWGMTAADTQNRLSVLRGQRLNFNQAIVVISPGTGLGQACILPHQNSYVITATEGGHKTIAPFNLKSAQLIEQHWRKHDYPLSWENWFSGSGLANLYSAMFPGEAVPENQTIGELANTQPRSNSGQCMELFAQAVYSEAGNLVLQYLAWGGVIIAGGIPPKVERVFHCEDNIDYIHCKSEYQDRLRAVPIAMCYESDIPLRGAAQYSKQLIKTITT